MIKVAQIKPGWVRLLVVLALGALTVPLQAAPLTIMGSSIVQPCVNEAVKLLKKQDEIEVSMNGGTDAGLAALGEGRVKMVMMARHLEPQDRAELPGLNLKEILLGRQVAALCVSADVWNSGIHQLSMEQARGIYEGRIKNWKELGGADQAISFFNWQEGFGMWELVAEWLYESTNRTPRGVFTPVESNEAASNAVEFTRGSIAVISPLIARAGSVFPLALGMPPGGKFVEPTPANVASGLYSLARPLVLVVDDRPVGVSKVLVEFLLSPQGQKCVSQRGFFPVQDQSAEAP